MHIHAENRGSASHIEHDFVLKHMLVLVNRIVVCPRAYFIFLCKVWSSYFMSPENQAST